MSVNLANCKDCGVLVCAHEYDGLCRECAARHVKRMESLYRALDRLGETDASMEKLAEVSGLTHHELRQLLRKTPALRRDLTSREPRVCTRCRHQALEEESGLCLSCRMTLLDRLQAAYAELEHKADKRRRQRRGWLPPDEDRHVGLVEMLERKRGKTPLKKLDPSPRGRFRS